MNPDVPCRVSADELAHDRAQEKLPFWTCERCNTELFEEDWVAQNWLVCKRMECSQVLCEDCCIWILGFTGSENVDHRYFGWESVHNLGFCSPACLAAAYERDGWEYRKGRLLKHCDEAQIDVDEAKARELAYPRDSYGAFACLSIGLVTLISQVRAVCNLERGKR